MSKQVFVDNLGVVMLTPSFYPYVGGAEKQALELSKTLAARGARVRVLTRRLEGLPSEETVQGIPVRRVAALGGGLINALVFMCSSFFFLLRKASEYHVVHVHLAGSPALTACFVSMLLGKRVVIKVGGGRGIGEIAVSGRSFSGRMKLRLLRLFGPRLVTVTEDLIEELRERGLEKNAVVIPNGVDTGRYKPASPPEKKALRKELGWPSGLCFLYVGRLAVEKRLGLFARAFARALKETGGDAFFVTAGSGPEEKPLREECARLGLEERVRILPPTDRIERLYAAADVFVLPSISEGLSNALLEAMSSGLGVLASRVGGTREAVVEEKTGLLYDSSDEEALAVRIGDLLKSPDLAERLGKAARERAQESYSLDSVADRYLELYGATREAFIEC